MVDYSNVRALVLCAGRGKRLGGDGSDLPKCMRTVQNRPLLSYTLEALDFLPHENTVLVVGYKKEDVLSAFPNYPYAVQTEQLGTGHAAECAEFAFTGFEGTVIIAYGDMPLLTRETFLAVLDTHIASNNDCTILAATSETPLPFGRVIQDENGAFLKIVEARDASPEELEVRELNAGVYAFNSKRLFEALKKAGYENDQKEKYLTDAPGIIKETGGRVGVCAKSIGDEILGINTLEDLRLVESIVSGKAN